MIRIMYYGETFGYCGDEFYSKEDESVMMKTVAINCKQASVSLGEPVMFKVVDMG